MDWRPEVEHRGACVKKFLFLFILFMSTASPVSAGLIGKSVGIELRTPTLSADVHTTTTTPFVVADPGVDFSVEFIFSRNLNTRGAIDIDFDDTGVTISSRETTGFGSISGPRNLYHIRFLNLFQFITGIVELPGVGREAELNVEGPVIDLEYTGWSPGMVDRYGFVLIPEPPTAVIALLDDILLGDELTLDGLGSFDPDGTVDQYEWDLDYDGSTFNADFTGGPIFSLTSANYDSFWGAGGPFNVGLRVTDNDGLTDIAATTIQVDLPAPDPSPVPEPSTILTFIIGLTLALFVRRRRGALVALGVTSEGEREVLGLWIANNEGAKFWLSIMNNLRNRGIEDILIAVVDGLKGFPDAINAAFPDTTVQTCIVHLVRHSLNFCGWKDRPPLPCKPMPPRRTVSEGLETNDRIRSVRSELVLPHTCFLSTPRRADAACCI